MGGGFVTDGSIVIAGPIVTAGPVVTAGLTVSPNDKGSSRRTTRIVKICSNAENLPNSQSRLTDYLLVSY